MIQGATAAQCTRKCVKQGSDFALVSGGKVYTLKGDKSQLDKLAGQECDRQRQGIRYHNDCRLDCGCQILVVEFTIRDELHGA